MHDTIIHSSTRRSSHSRKNAKHIQYWMNEKNTDDDSQPQPLIAKTLKLIASVSLSLCVSMCECLWLCCRWAELCASKFVFLFLFPLYLYNSLITYCGESLTSKNKRESATTEAVALKALYTSTNQSILLSVVIQWTSNSSNSKHHIGNERDNLKYRFPQRAATTHTKSNWIILLWKIIKWWKFLKSTQCARVCAHIIELNRRPSKWIKISDI